MAKVRILQYPDPKLKRIAKKVTDFGPTTQKIIDDMFETHYASDNCAALAATQLDIPDAPAITVIDFSAKKDDPLCLVNPEVVEGEGERTEEEGCMSVGEVSGMVFEKVTRYDRAHIKAQDRDGKELDFWADGFMAKCCQHEIDHLNGRLFIDKLSRLKRERVEKKLEKIRRQIEKRQA